MMNNLQEFTNGDIKLPVRTNENGDIEFNVDQAAIGLGISHLAPSGNTVVRWDRVRKYLSCPQVGTGDFITEPQFYKLAIKANNPTAEKFQDWVTSEVLPTIRKHGAYLTDSAIEQTLTDPDYLIKLATQLKTEREGRLIAEQQVNELTPKATYYDKVLADDSLLTITMIAKDYGKSGVEMNKLLHELGVQYKQGKTWLLFAKYQRNGWTHSKTFMVKDKSGVEHARVTTKWTQKGRLGLYELLKQHNIYPTIEQLVEV